MITAQCACGYASDEPGALVDHFEEVFTPTDDVGSDNRAHAQVAHDRAIDFARIPDGGRAPRLVCLCGFGTDEQAEFDDHLLSVFITPDRIGTDGKKHTPAPEPSEAIQNNRRNVDPVLLLCPGCCTTDDIPPWTPTIEMPAPLAGCKRFTFMFPILPGDYARLTSDAIRNHACSGAAQGNWPGLGQAIIDAIHEGAIGPSELAARLDTAWPGPLTMSL
jgi:hypothetical protein